MAEARFAPPKPNVSVFQGGSGQCLTLNNGRSMPAAGLGAWALRGRRAHGLRLQASSRRYGVLLRNRTGGRPGGARSRALGHPPRRHFCADETQSFAVRRSRASFEGRDDATRFGLCRHGDPSSSRSERSRRLPREGKGGGARPCAPDRTLERVRRRAHDLSSGFRTRPALVQNEIHPFHRERDVVPVVRKEGIAVQSRYPLGGRGRTKAIFAHPTITGIAKRLGRTPAQVVLRWHLERGVAVIPGSSDPGRIRRRTMRLLTCSGRPARDRGHGPGRKARLVLSAKESSC